MMLILILLAHFDSIPPLPELTGSEFPEPIFWSMQADDMLRINAYAGQFFGLNTDVRHQGLTVTGQYSRRNEWDSARAGNATLSYPISWPRFWMAPRLKGNLLKRDDEYACISPGTEFTLFTPSLVAAGALDWNRWRLNDETVYEAVGSLIFTFDRITYMPQLEMSGIYTQRRIKSSLHTQVHVGNFHLKIGSLVNTGFPSPKLSISYSEPWINIVTGFGSGIQHRTLESIFTPQLPLRYPVGVPAETLSVISDLYLEFNFVGQYVKLGASYKEWLCRLNVGDDFMVSQTKSVKETNLSISVRNTWKVKELHLSNKLRVSYNASDSALVFLPDHAIADTLTMRIGMIEMSADARYESRRDGIAKPLPAYYTLNTTAGIRISAIKFYIAVANLTNRKSEIYDDYHLIGRKYAGGIEMNQRL
jgi:hypothetical protein